MKVIDHNGRLFGKISVIDVLVILVVIALAGALYVKNSRPHTSASVTTQTITYQVLVEGAQNYLKENIHVGDKVYDLNYSSGGSALGSLQLSILPASTFASSFNCKSRSFRAVTLFIFIQKLPVCKSALDRARSPPWGPGDPPPLPVSIADFGRFCDFLPRICPENASFVAFLRVAKVMCRLQVAPILGRSAGRSIPELPPLRHRFDLINDKGQRMRGIGRLIVMDRPQPAVADAALSAHGLQPGAVLAAQGPVGIPGIAGRSFLHRHPRWLF